MENLRKLLNEFKCTLNEGSYDDFMDNYGTQTSQLLSKIKAKSGEFMKNQDKYSENEHMAKMKEWESDLSNYDKNIVEAIIEMYLGTEYSTREVAEMAMDNQDRNGTEMKQVVNAMEESLEEFDY